MRGKVDLILKLGQLTEYLTNNIFMKKVCRKRALENNFGNLNFGK